MTPEAEKIWKFAYHYVELAQQYLLPPAVRDSVEQVHLSFLFPLWPERTHNKLIEFIRRVRVERGAVGWDKLLPTPRSAQAVEHLEAATQELRNELESLLAACSPVQREILLEKFWGMTGQNPTGPKTL